MCFFNFSGFCEWILFYYFSTFFLFFAAFDCKKYLICCAIVYARFFVVARSLFFFHFSKLSRGLMCEWILPAERWIFKKLERRWSQSKKTNKKINGWSVRSLGQSLCENWATIVVLSFSDCVALESFSEWNKDYEQQTVKSCENRFSQFDKFEVFEFVAFCKTIK